MTPPRQKRDKLMKFGAMLAIFLSAALCAHSGQSHQENAQKCSDSLCPLPASGEATLSVVSPVPETAIEPMAAAPRLKSLNGKTIALVGGSFMANVTHPELKRLILAEFPTARVYVLSEIGSAGPWSRPGVVRREKDEFQRKLKDFKVDAVVSGNGGCGLCTPKETGSCIAAEALGIPSVMIAATGFVKQARNAAASAGLASLSVAEYPGAFASHTREQLLENTRKVLWPQIKAGLQGNTTTGRARSPSTPSAASSMPPYQNNAISGTFSEIQRIFLDSGWTDGLPIIPPTEDAVAEFFEFSDLPRFATRPLRTTHPTATKASRRCLPTCAVFSRTSRSSPIRRRYCAVSVFLRGAIRSRHLEQLQRQSPLLRLSPLLQSGMLRPLVRWRQRTRRPHVLRNRSPQR